MPALAMKAGGQIAGDWALVAQNTMLLTIVLALGALPFAAIAGVTDLVARRLRVLDAVLPALASILAIPALLYLSADLAAVGAKATRAGLASYVAFEALEAAPLLMIAAWAAHRQRLGLTTLAVIAAMPLLLPLGQVGFAGDFVMRASIAPLALLALMVAESVVTERARGRLAMAAGILGLGAITGWHEVRRALTLPPSPPPLCSFYGAWGPSPASNKSTYLAAVARLPAAIRPERVALVPDTDPPRCWARDWPKPTGI